MILTSVTKFVDFSKFLVSKLVTKVAKIYGNYLGYFENETFWWKTAGPTVWQILGYFLFQHLVSLILTHFFLPTMSWFQANIVTSNSSLTTWCLIFIERGISIKMNVFSYPGFFWWDKDILPGVSGELQIV